jgi:hypothetical protein
MVLGTSGLLSGATAETQQQAATALLINCLRESWFTLTADFVL